MKINELLTLLFSTQAQSWMTLLAITGLLPQLENKDLPAQDFIELLNDTLQNKDNGWLRPSGKERWEVVSKYSPEQQKDILHELDHLGLFAEIKPSKTHYDCAFLMSTTADDAKGRLNNLIQLWDNGIRFDRLYVMAVHRDLSHHSEIHMIEILKEKNLGLNEIEMMRLIMNDYLEGPQAFSGRPPDIIYDNAPRPEGAKRGTTMDSFVRWKLLYAGKTPDRSILIISCQPFVLYQSAVAFQILSDNYHEVVRQTALMDAKGSIGDQFEIEAVGHAKANDELPDIGLDSLARFVYSSKDSWKKIHIKQ